MKCIGCGFPYAPHELWTEQCIQCVGRERDEFEAILKALISETALAEAREAAKKRSHPTN